ncbi:MAG: GAF domain-containing sensor histidine kinase [Candidatus Promineifilaceae bacterium]|nr:GAF domain-containing sensor histidine kinase [Candidatus Promineifilaceae bacterium]
MNEAALAIASAVSLDRVLQQITDSARELAGARYAALGVPDSEEHLSNFVISGIATQEAAQIPHRPEGVGLLGAIMREGRVIRLRDLQDDPRSAGFPKGHRAMKTFLGVPIKAGSEILGNLYLTDKGVQRPDGSWELASEFTQADQELVEMLAAHAAIAIQNARLYEQVGRLAVIEERSRIGMDLHDGVIQSIYAVGLTLESARLLLPEDPNEANEILQQTIASLNDVIRDIRNFILDLRPQRFSGDLSQALARLVREFQANAMIPVNFTADPDLIGELPQPIARTIFLTTQEALANVARHARASQVSVQVERQDGDAVLSIADNGVGFDVREQVQAVGHGLANMRARAEERGGSFTVDSSLGAGTTVCLEVPIRPPTEY